MQFQNPEILYFLPLLIIPILVHLFQLQKFIKIPFTNVAFLQQITQQNRKSLQLKKWLILATRTILLLAILFAFSQPFISNKNKNTKQHTYIYLDNSLSSSAEGERGNLLKKVAQNIIENASRKGRYSFETNSSFYKNIGYDELKSKLLNLNTKQNTPNFESVLLKMGNKTLSRSNTLNKNILISDFQNTYKNLFTNVNSDFSTIILKPAIKNNLSIDSVFINNTANKNSNVNVRVKNQGDQKKNIPIAIYNNEKLISKQSFNIEENATKTVSFSIKNTTNLNGKITITYSDTFYFDNTFYFKTNPIKKINVLLIGKANNFISKIYTKNEFNFEHVLVKNLNYNTLEKQELLIVNELESIPKILSKSIQEFTKKGGTLVIIPNSKTNITSYNSFFRNFSNFRIQTKQHDSLRISKINFNHPLFKNVFSKKVSNFQYPKTREFFLSNSKNTNTIIQFENNKNFLSQINYNQEKIYWFSTPLSLDITNFSNSPLIVPVFYNFGKLSFQHSQLYFRLGKINKIDVDVKLEKDKILSIANTEHSFIPQQQTHQNKVSLTLSNNNLKPGFYNIIKDNNTIQTIAFNTSKKESQLDFLDMNLIAKQNKNITINTSVKEVLSKLNKKNEVRWLWKWFLALAIVSLCLEIFILKFYKP